MNVSFQVAKRFIIISFILLLTVTLMMSLFAGCGVEKKECTAPDQSTITITPSFQQVKTSSGLSTDMPFDWTVIVKYQDGTPMPQACITVSGSQAVPNAGGAYQFQYYPSWTSPNLAVDSGFSAQTDDYGQYTFSTVASAGSSTWSDTIYVRSGAIVSTAFLAVNDTSY